MKTVILQSAAAVLVTEATVNLPSFPDVISFNNVLYARRWISEKRAGYVEATVHAL